jgi:hypothetical protein
MKSIYSLLSFLFTSIILLLAPIQGLLIAVSVAIAIDTLLGVFKTVKLNGWQSFKSKNLGNIVGKLILYQSSLILIYIIDYNLLSEFFKLWFSIPLFFTKIVAIILIFIEMVSVKENFEEAFKVDVFALLKSALSRTKDLKDEATEIIK